MNLILLILGFETPPLEAYGTRRFKRYEWSNSRLGVTISAVTDIPPFFGKDKKKFGQKVFK